MSAPDIGSCRSFLFTPGNRPERFAKGAASGADALILDLEDAVAHSDKDHARKTVIEHFRGNWRATLAPGQFCGLRVNNIFTADGAADLAALVASRIAPDFIAIPKVESAAEVELFVRQLNGVQEGVQFQCAIETARGLAAAMAIAAASPRVRALAFGGADLAVDLRAELAWEPMFVARAQLVQAAAAAGIGLVDVPHVDLNDDAGLRRDTTRVKAMGFTGKLAIHPKQVKPIQDLFTPTQEEAARAAGIVAAYERAGGNVIEFQGKMVEGPIVRAQQRVLALAARAGVPTEPPVRAAPVASVPDKAGPFTAYCSAGASRYIERFGLEFEAFAVGQRFKHRPGVTITQQDNLDEALDTLNSAMIHYDAHYSAQTAWKKPLMVSTVTLQRVIGMASKTFGRRRAIREFKEIAMTAPVFGGDTLYAESEILGVEGGSDPDCGLVHAATLGINAEGKVVARITYVAEVYRRGRDPEERRGAAPATPAAAPRFAHHRQQADGTLVEQFGFFFEDCEPGETYQHYSRRTFHRDEAIEHAYRALDLVPQYHDERWIRDHQDGRYRIPEYWLLGTATALTTRTFGRVAANLGWFDIRLHEPVFAGDTIHAESTILDKRESKSRPNEGILGVETRAYNQHGAIVVSYKRNLLVYKRDADTPYARAGYA